MLQLKLRDMVIIMEIELTEVILKWAIMLLLYLSTVYGIIIITTRTQLFYKHFL